MPKRATHQEYTQRGDDESCDELDNVAAGDGHGALLAVVVLGVRALETLRCWTTATYILSKVALLKAIRERRAV